MRKKIIIIMTAIVLFGGFIAGYRNINQKYPARKVETAEKGESLEFLDGVKISANVVKWLSTEEQAAIYENSGIDTSKVNYDTKIIEVNVCLKNTTEEEKEVPITYLSLETTGVGTAISRELLMGNSEHYSSMVEKLEPGEEKVVIYPYEICSIWFHKKDWKNVEKRSFWLTFSSYPEKNSFIFMSPGLKQNGSIIKNIVWSIPVIQMPFQKGIGNITAGRNQVTSMGENGIEGL